MFREKGYFEALHVCISVRVTKNECPCITVLVGMMYSVSAFHVQHCNVLNDGICDPGYYSTLSPPRTASIPGNYNKHGLVGNTVWLLVQYTCAHIDRHDNSSSKMKP